MALANELVHGTQPAGFLAWCQNFGPMEPSRPGSVRALGRLWTAASAKDLDNTLDQLTLRYPRREDGVALKHELLTGRSNRWNAKDPALLLALIRWAGEPFDPADLKVTARVATQARVGAWREVVAALPPEPVPREWRACIVKGLSCHPDPHMPAAVSERPGWAIEILVASGLASDSAAWDLLDEATVLRAFETTSGPEASSVLVALLNSRHAGRVLRTLSDSDVAAAIDRMDDERVRGIADVLIDAGVLRAARPALTIRLAAAGAELPTGLLVDSLLAEPAPKDRRWRQAAMQAKKLAPPSRILALADAGAPVGPKELRTALDRTRSRPDDRWYRFAVQAMRDDPKALEVVFGPLHSAITADRLPRDLWQTLDVITPKAHDPARRLRLLLIKRIRDEKWSKGRTSKAVRDAGPYGKQILQDLNGDAPLVKLFKAVFKVF